MRIEARGIVKRFEERTALGGVDLLLDRPGVFVLAGPNGSGKTTLLRILSLLERPDEGQLLMDGLPVNFRSGHSTILRLRRRVMMVHAPAVMLRGSVLENIEYGLAVRGVTRKKRLKKAIEVIERLRLKGFERRDAAALSAGETQRVALARALAVSPEVLLLDEPTSNLDPLSVCLIEETIRTMASGGTCVFLATHHLQMAESLAERVWEMKEGSIVRIETFEGPSGKVKQAHP
ncbi:MAG: ATP-binding cassette domain-containing protein [bacterium]